MKEIEYKVLGVDDLELLVELRIKDLKMLLLAYKKGLIKEK